MLKSYNALTRVLLVFVMVSAVAGFPSCAFSAEQRVALVIGNSAYKEAPLANPVNDARDMARALAAHGFQVILKENVAQREMKQSIREFAAGLKKGGVELFYFAGHGIQSKGRNYLVPVNADIQGEFELDDQAVDTNLVLGAMDEAKNRINIVILDACRNNPFGRSFRSAASGLAQMDAARGTLIAYATSPGSVAADGAGRNGVYTKHLLASLQQPDSDVSRVLSRVRSGVVAETNGRQTPWESTSLIGDFFFNPAQTLDPSRVPVTVPSLADSPLAVEIAYWESIQKAGTVEDFEAYLRRYPEGQFTDIAKNRIEQSKLATTSAAVRPDPASLPRATVHFYRPTKFVWSAVDAVVTVKGRELGKLPNGSYFTASVLAGELVVALELAGGSSIQRHFDIEADRIYYLRAEAFFGGGSTLTLAPTVKAISEIKELRDTGVATVK